MYANVCKELSLILLFIEHANRDPNQETYRPTQVCLHFLIKPTSHYLSRTYLMVEYNLSVCEEGHMNSTSSSFKHAIKCAWCYNTYMLLYVSTTYEKIIGYVSCHCHAILSVQLYNWSNMVKSSYSKLIAMYKGPLCTPLYSTISAYSWIFVKAQKNLYCSYFSWKYTTEQQQICIDKIVHKFAMLNVIIYRVQAVCR